MEYPLHDKAVAITSCGRICLHSKKISFSQAFAGQKVGIKETEDKIGLVSFINFDEDAYRVEPLDNLLKDGPIGDGGVNAAEK